MLHLPAKLAPYTVVDLPVSTGMTSTQTRKLRILCFHGYLQNAQVTAAVGRAVPHGDVFCTAVQPASDLQIYLQNVSKCLLEQEFAGKIGSLRKALKSRAELIFIDAPHHVEAEQSISDPAAVDPRAWWKWQVCL